VTGPRGLGHIVAGILCVLDLTNVGSIPLATVGASKRLPSDMYLIYHDSSLDIKYIVLRTFVNYVRLSCNKIEVEFIIIFFII